MQTGRKETATAAEWRMPQPQRNRTAALSPSAAHRGRIHRAAWLTRDRSCCAVVLLLFPLLFSQVQDIEVEEMVIESIPLDPMTALKIVLRTSMFHDGLARGLHEAVKALDRREAHLCVLANSCDEPAYTKLITALCKEHSIPLIKVEDNKTLGEWAGLARFNAEGKAVKVVGCSCVVVRSWGEETEARQYILDHVKSA